MPISILRPENRVYVPQSYLTNITGTLYELDTNQFRLDLGALMDDEEEIVFNDAHDHIAGYTVAGVSYSRKVEMVNSYQVEFEDGQYSVVLEESNNNIFDVEGGILYQNQVQIISKNSAGLQLVSVGSGLSTDEHTWLEALYNSYKKFLTKGFWLGLKR